MYENHGKMKSVKRRTFAVNILWWGEERALPKAKAEQLERRMSDRKVEQPQGNIHINGENQKLHSGVMEKNTDFPRQTLHTEDAAKKKTEAQAGR